jgi:hypothetical protein
VDDPGKLYRQRRRATQDKGLETLDSKAEVEGPSESPRESPPPSPKEHQPQPPPMGEQPQLERKIELCTPDVVDLPTKNLQDAGRPFKIKVSTICMVQHSPFTALRWFHTLLAESNQDWEALMRNFMEFYSPTKTQSLRNKVDTFVQFPMETIEEALEHLNEYMQVEFLEWHTDFLKRRMEKMEVEREARDLKASEARSTCEEREEYDHVQGKLRFNASSSIQDLVPLCTQLKDFMDEQAKINKDAFTKFETMEKILENLDGKVTEVGSSIREVFIVMKMLEMQVGQLVRHPMGTKGEFPPQGLEKAKATQTHLGEMEDHTKETTKIMTEGPKFEMTSHYMKEVVASIKTKGQSQPVKTKNMTKPKNKPVPKMVGKWVSKIATPAKSFDPK